MGWLASRLRRKWAQFVNVPWPVGVLAQKYIAVTVASLLWENIVKYRLDFESGLIYQSEHCLWVYIVLISPFSAACIYFMKKRRLSIQLGNTSTHRARAYHHLGFKLRSCIAINRSIHLRYWMSSTDGPIITHLRSLLCYSRPLLHHNNSSS